MNRFHVYILYILDWTIFKPLKKYYRYNTKITIKSPKKNSTKETLNTKNK
jgi:hypothetical protein